MNDTHAPRTLDLDRGELLHLPHARGSVLRVNRGVVWLTQHRDPRDIVLQPGDSWMVERGGLTLAQAQSAATVTVSGRAAHRAHRHNRRRPILARIAAWFQDVASALPGRRVPYF